MCESRRVAVNKSIAGINYEISVVCTVCEIKRIVEQVYEDENVREDTMCGWVCERGENHPFYILDHGPSWVNNIMDVTRSRLIDAGLMEEGDAFFIDDFFEFLLDLPSCSNTWAFSDECTICDACGQIIYTQPQHACWQPDYWLDECEFVCGDCIRDDEDIAESYLEYLDKNHKSCNTIFTAQQLRDQGFEKCRMFEHCDCPEAVLHEIKKEVSPEANNIIFHLDFVSPFDTNYSVYTRCVA